MKLKIDATLTIFAAEIQQFCPFEKKIDNFSLD